MRLRDIPIRRKLMLALLLTSGLVLMLACAGFITYEIITLRKGMLEAYTTRAAIIAANSTASLAFQNEADATEVLGALKTDPRVMAACLYDDKGKLFAKYPADAAPGVFPPEPGESGYRPGHLEVFRLVVQDGRILGTVYVQSNLSALSDRYHAYAWLSAAIIAGSLLVAFLLSGLLQKQISQSILALAATAQAISKNRDFSVRAKKFGEDEMGALTDAFNQMLTEILQTELRLSTVVQNAPLILYSLDSKGVVTLSTGKGLEAIGLKPGGNTGKSVFDVYPENSRILEMVKKALGGEEAHGLIEVNGHFVEALYKPIKDQQGKVMEVVGVAIDVTARRKAEETLKKVTESQNFVASILENVPNMIFVKDAKDLRFVMFNKAGEDILGVPQADLIGKNDYDFFPKEDADFFTSKDRKVLESGKPLDIPEESLQTRGKGVRILHTKKIPILNEDGTPKYLLGISEDITEQKAQENLKIYTKALETSNQELQDFVFVASHDLQEPLRKIQSFGGFLQEEFKEALGETGRDYVERMRSAANRMQTLINDLLALTRVTTKAQPFVSTSLSKVIEGVLSDLETRVEETKAKVEVGPLPTLEADATQMRQLFQNLIGNALKFQKPGVPPEIHIHGEVLNGSGPEGKQCRIWVEDKGIGFDNKYADQIFKVFERLHGRDEYEGTGIGLAVCRKVVERHKGTIQAEGLPGKGSTFIVTLPLQQKR